MQIAGQSASALLAFHPTNATALRWEDCPFRPIPARHASCCYKCPFSPRSHSSPAEHGGLDTHVTRKLTFFFFSDAYLQRGGNTLAASMHRQLKARDLLTAPEGKAEC